MPNKERGQGEELNPPEDKRHELPLYRDQVQAMRYALAQGDDQAAQDIYREKVKEAGIVKAVPIEDLPEQDLRKVRTLLIDTCVKQNVSWKAFLAGGKTPAPKLPAPQRG